MKLDMYKLRALDRLPDGWNAWVHHAQGWTKRLPQHKRLLRRQAEKCVAACDRLGSLDRSALLDILIGHEECVRRNTRLPQERLTNAMAAIGQMARLELGYQPNPIQFMGALALYHGWMVEMATGEGKNVNDRASGYYGGLDR